MPEPKVIVGRNIRQLRLEKEPHMTQEVLAANAKMHPVEVGRAERGQRDLRLSTVAKIAAGLEVPAADLLRGV
jgi:transcriptional regulator with XRE-family HTH domain